MEYDEEANKYFVYYNKQINGIEASDFAYVSVNDSGCVTSYYSNMLGKVPADIAVNFNIETVKKEVEIKLNSIYEETKKVYDKVEFTLEGIILSVLEDGTPILIVTYDVYCVNYHKDGTSTHTGEMVQFVVKEHLL